MEISRNSISSEFIIGTVGFLTAFSTILGLLTVFPGNEKLSGGGLLGTTGVIPVSVVLAVAMAAMFLVVSVFQERIACAKQPILVVFGLVGAISIALAGILGLEYPLSFALVLLSACGASCLACTWFCWFCAQSALRTRFLIGIACFWACAICMVEKSLGGALLNAFAVCFQCVVSVVCAFIIRRNGATLNKFPSISNSESDFRSRILPESTFKFSLDSFQFGLVIGVACAAGCELPCMFCGLCAAALFLADASSACFVTERNMAMFVSPLSCGAIFCLFLFDRSGQVVALCALSAAFVVITCVGWMAMWGHVNISRLSPLRIFSKARRVQYCFMACGIVVGLALLGLSESGSEGWVASVRISVAVGIGLVFASSVLHRSRFPEAGLEEDDNSAIEHSVSWIRRCRAFCESNGLSDRQAEVLMLIAQGRNAKYVQQELSISLSTAQTHIRNIYRKVGCHSRQELLDEIEKTKLYGEE